MLIKPHKTTRWGRPIICKVCGHTFEIYGKCGLESTDEEVVKSLAAYHLWKLSVKIHQANCANKKTTEILGGIYPC